MTGQGRTIGILEFAAQLAMAYTQHFLASFALHNQVTVKKVDGAGRGHSPQTGCRSPPRDFRTSRSFRRRRPS